ncbi:MAG: mandelate racemase/muconate lactonizing enzyme family protein [Clostridia bacterium]|jgi:L-alanine-DL-glutamate epimerase-like enolase superfamily enzyme|nr:mandelate racemase/muconate lactonizing enzyme family protein [Bacillota bacterium]MBR3301830.1 mandelate racemase/muconate lactonizing enzyme family protein [Bacillota bacterium]MBR6237262.1 mandelate racemase/muconate lactonizing enzyme family protein [Bacillota bacterium]MCR5009999.1 mandelate racemase/muconate lactonizing enzyme family protein [Clostridia bacterium]
MKIVGLELIPLTMIFKANIKESFGTVGKREDNLIIKIYTDEGIYGLGEACTLGPFYCGESQETVMGIIQHHLYPKVLEGADPFDVEMIHVKMDKFVYANTVAKAGVDYALHDIIGKKLGVPLYKLLGASKPYFDKIPTRASVGIDDPKAMAEKAAMLHEMGFGGIKMKVGLEPIKDIERVKAIRDAIGPDMLIDIDVNGAYRAKEAVYMLRRVQDCGNIIVEQPVGRDDYEGMKYVRERVDIPIGACEAALSQQQIMRLIRMDACDFFNFKPTRSGGIFPAKQVMHMAEAAGKFIVLSEQLGSSVELSAVGHLAFSTPTIMIPGGYAAGVMGMAGRFTTEGSDADIVDNPMQVKGGCLLPPTDNPGLGVDLVEEKWRRYLTEGKEIVRLGKCD